MDEDKLSYAVIGAAIDVHKSLGPGLLESVYQKCLAYELKLRGLDVKSEVSLPITYKTLQLDNAYRIDLLVGNRLIVELKAAESILPVFTAQVLSYLKMRNLKLGLIINFNVPCLRDGIKRIANNY